MPSLWSFPGSLARNCHIPAAYIVSGGCGDWQLHAIGCSYEVHIEKAEIIAASLYFSHTYDRLLLFLGSDRASRGQALEHRLSSRGAELSPLAASQQSRPMGAPVDLRRCSDHLGLPFESE